MFTVLSPLIDSEQLRAETMYYLFTFVFLVYSPVHSVQIIFLKWQKNAEKMKGDLEIKKKMSPLHFLHVKEER